MNSSKVEHPESKSPRDYKLPIQEVFFRLLAYGTLFVDAYLGLAFNASRLMQNEIPPFGWPGFLMPRPLQLGIICWTAVLAVGCLSGREKPKPILGLILWPMLVICLILIVEIVRFIVALLSLWL